MISALIMSAALALATPSLSQMPAQESPAPAPAPVAPAPAPSADFPILPPAVVVPDCGRLLASSAYCLSADLTAIGGLAEQYITVLEGQGWLAADGDDNRVIFVRRNDSGTCDGLQMMAFYDESRPVSPTTVGYLGFAVIPGNICVAAPAQGPASQ
jgi:hypothetical protein